MEKVTKMSDETLEGLRVATLVSDGFEEVELTKPRKALDRGRRVFPRGDEVRGWNFTD
jgi:protease I